MIKALIASLYYKSLIWSKIFLTMYISLVLTLVYIKFCPKKSIFLGPI